MQFGLRLVPEMLRNTNDCLSSLNKRAGDWSIPEMLKTDGRTVRIAHGPLIFEMSQNTTSIVGLLVQLSDTSNVKSNTRCEEQIAIQFVGQSLRKKLDTNILTLSRGLRDASKYNISRGFAYTTLRPSKL